MKLLLHLSSSYDVTLNGEDIGDSGARIVADALAANMTVTALGLSGNKIGESVND